ncbi:MAG TPA: hypothetical protein VMZ29_09310 [Candidatus Bathyarchaeia archaeon]|nr:hypothetical protein [Candidatus Bathyarchaeia archaeon]
MSKIHNIKNWMKKHQKVTVGIIIALLVIFIPISGLIGNFHGKSVQKKPIDINFSSIYSITQIFDGFEVNVYNLSITETTTYEYGLDSYSFNQIGTSYNSGPYEPDNSFRQYLKIIPAYQSNCRFQDITFILDDSNGIDYSKLNIIIYGDGDLIYCNSNIKSDLTVEFDPRVIEIMILVF